MAERCPARPWNNVSKFGTVDPEDKWAATQDEVSEYLRIAKHFLDHYYLVSLCLLLGARVGSVMELQVRDFQVNGAIRTLRIGESKTTAYTAHLNQETYELCKSLVVGKKPSDWLVTHRGQQWRENGYWFRHHRIVKAAVAPHPVTGRLMSFNELTRHSHGTLALEGGGSTYDVAMSLGHKDDEMLRRYYNHPSTKHRQGYAEEFSPRFGIEPLETNVTPIKKAS